MIIDTILNRWIKQASIINTRNVPYPQPERKTKENPIQQSIYFRFRQRAKKMVGLLHP